MDGMNIKHSCIVSYWGWYFLNPIVPPNPWKEILEKDQSINNIDDGNDLSLSPKMAENNLVRRNNDMWSQNMVALN